MPHPDDAAHSAYLDRPCRSEDEYWRERCDGLQKDAETIHNARCALITVVYNAAQKYHGRRRLAFIDAWNDRLDDAWNETIGAELADAKAKMEGN